MASNHRNKLLNQAQISSLGKYINPRRASSDLNTAKDAIHILQDKVDYINNKFMPKADAKLQKGLGMDKGKYAYFKYNMSRTPSGIRNNIKGIVNGNVNQKAFMKAYQQAEAETKAKNDSDHQSNDETTDKQNTSHDSSSPSNNHEPNKHHKDNAHHNDRDHGSQYEDNPFIENNGNNDDFLNHHR